MGFHKFGTDSWFSARTITCPLTSEVFAYTDIQGPHPPSENTGEFCACSPLCMNYSLITARKRTVNNKPTNALPTSKFLSQCRKLLVVMAPNRRQSICNSHEDIGRSVPYQESIHYHIMRYKVLQECAVWWGYFPSYRDQQLPHKSSLMKRVFVSIEAEKK